MRILCVWVNSAVKKKIWDTQSSGIYTQYYIGFGSFSHSQDYIYMDVDIIIIFRPLTKKKKNLKIYSHVWVIWVVHLFIYPVFLIRCFDVYIFVTRGKILYAVYFLSLFFFVSSVGTVPLFGVWMNNHCEFMRKHLLKCFYTVLLFLFLTEPFGWGCQPQNYFGGKQDKLNQKKKANFNCKTCQCLYGNEAKKGGLIKYVK